MTGGRFLRACESVAGTASEPSLPSYILPRLVETRAFPSGAVLLRYDVVR